MNVDPYNPKFQTAILAIAGISMFMDGLDGSIINIALPELAMTFGTDTGTISWVSMAYLLLIAGTVLIFGRIADSGYIKKILLIGIGLFTIGSAICGISGDLIILLAARLLQGLGASMMIACAPLLCVKFLPLKIVGMSIALITAVVSVGFALGPAAGGFILEYLSWHWIFLINIPVGIISLIAALKIVPEEKVTSKMQFDYLGSVIAFIAITSLIVIVERLSHIGLSNVMILLIIVFLISMAAFIIREYKCSYPLIKPQLFLKSWKLSSVTLAFLIIQVEFIAIIYLIPFYIISALGCGALISGLIMLITPLVAAVFSTPIGKLSDKHGRKIYTVLSIVFLIISFVICAVILPEWELLPLIISLAFAGLSISFFSGPGASRIIDYMPDSDKGTGSIVMTLCIYLGGLIGTALSAGVFTYLTSGIGSTINFADLPVDQFVFGFHGVFIIALIPIVVALILSAVVGDLEITDKKISESACGADERK